MSPAPLNDSILDALRAEYVEARRQEAEEGGTPDPEKLAAEHLARAAEVERAHLGSVPMHEYRRLRAEGFDGTGSATLAADAASTERAASRPSARAPQGPMGDPHADKLAKPDPGGLTRESAAVLGRLGALDMDSYRAARRLQREELGR